MKKKNYTEGILARSGLNSASEWTRRIFFSSRRRHTRFKCDWSSDVCSSDLEVPLYLADYVLGTYGTGAIMAVPGEDQRDLDFAFVYELPVVKTTERPEGWTEPVYTGPGRKINSGLLEGMDVAEARRSPPP